MAEEFAVGTPENPCTPENSSASDIQYKFCKCSDCGYVSLCTSQSDFYFSDTKDSLRCEGCFRQYTALLLAPISSQAN